MNRSRSANALREPGVRIRPSRPCRTLLAARRQPIESAPPARPPGRAAGFAEAPNQALRPPCAVLPFRFLSRMSLVWQARAFIVAHSAACRSAESPLIRFPLAARANGHRRPVLSAIGATHWRGACKRMQSRDDDLGPCRSRTQGTATAISLHVPEARPGSRRAVRPGLQAPVR